MQKAEYPQKTCREGMMSDTGIGYNCELPTLHSGPCGNFSIPFSVTKRDEWEAANPDWKERPNPGGDIIV